MLFSNLCNGQKEIKNDLKKNKIKGNVALIEYYNYDNFLNSIKFVSKIHKHNPTNIFIIS